MQQHQYSFTVVLLVMVTLWDPEILWHYSDQDYGIFGLLTAYETCERLSSTNSIVLAPASSCSLHGFDSVTTGTL